jgi:ComF family protein
LGRQLGYDLKQLNWADNIDMIIPIPLHEKKEAERGYNQSVLIAEGMSDILNIPVAANILVRTRYTESQTQKTRTERLENMKDAFKTVGDSLSGKHILLVDDVLTTGATLEAAALALTSSYKVKISIATIGIAT